MKTSEFHYELPADAIAQSAIEPRHDSRLLDTRDMSDHRFRDLPEILEPGDLVMVNRTRVRRARLRGAKSETGGAVEVLLLRPLGDGGWEALVRPARRLRRGSVVELPGATIVLRSDPERGRAVIDVGHGSLDAAMDAGEIPLPPYFSGSLTDPERYQTVYGDRVGSAAAPTAGLHFTDTVLEDLAERGIGLASIDLEVGLDTFRPIQTDSIEDHEMHRESFTVSEDAVSAVERARAGGGRVVAIGTTVVRAMEAASQSGLLAPFEGETDLFITPGHRFRSVDLLVTNFHVPGSTLVVLVAAFMGDRWRAAYRTALDRRYRFLSFGDAMLAVPG